MKHIVLSVAVVLASAGSALAATPYQADAVCPVGGEKFKYTSTGSWSTWGERPDGKPYGSWIFPSPLPECPGNKLVMYREFSPVEIEQRRARFVFREEMLAHEHEVVVAVASLR